MSRLPNDSYRVDLIYKNSFNNNLISGISQGLSLYSPDEDIKLYNYLDTKPIQNVNFNDINKKLDDKDNYYDKGKNLISGLVQGLNDATEGTEKNISDTFNKVKDSLTLSPEIKIFGLLTALFLLINRK